MPGEFDFIDWIQSQQRAGRLVQTPAGDDMAVLDWPAGELLLVGVDQIMDGVHFDSQIHSPRQIGKKVMNRNLSDCAAMACLPAAAVVSVALPRGCGLDYARELYLGIKNAADPFDCQIVGGDTGSWDGKLVCSVTVMGRCGGITPVLRSGAKPGDWIYVTGALGGSILGRHMDFVPRIKIARDLAGQYRLTAMLDISDGLSRDLGHLCRASQVAAQLQAAAIPIHDDARRLSLGDRIPPIEHALHDGEDHELVFTSPDDIPQATRIGQIADGSGIVIVQSGVARPLPVRAWEHRL